VEEKVVMHHGEWSAVRRTYNYYRDDDDVYDDDETRDDTNHTNTNNNNTKIAHSLQRILVTYPQYFLILRR